MLNKEFKFRKFCNLLIFKKPPPTPSKGGNEIVYDSQGVRERIFSRLIDNFYFFNGFIPPLGGGKGEVYFAIY